MTHQGDLLANEGSGHASCNKGDRSCFGFGPGATLDTKRTTAERLLQGVDPNALVFEAFANPFIVYPLSVDYLGFKELLSGGVDCYILNTGDFMEKR